MKKSLYENVQNDFKKKIESGKYEKDEKLPSEEQLCKFYDVSKVTLRKALSNLIDEGYIYAKPRIGYFVTIPENDSFVLQYDMEIACTESITKIELADIYVMASVHDASIKELKITHQYSVEDVIVAVEFCTVPMQFSFSSAAKREKLVIYYKKIFPMIFSYAARKELLISAVNGDDTVCAYLDCFENDPLLNVEIDYYDDYNKVFAHKSVYYLEEYVLLNASMEKNRK